MILDIKLKLECYKLEQGEDCPYQKEIVISATNDIDNNGMMILKIEGQEYYVNKKDFKTTIDILDRE